MNALALALHRQGKMSRACAIALAHAQKREQLRRKPVPTGQEMERLALGSENQHQAWAYYRQQLHATGSHLAAVKKCCWWLSD